MPPKLLLAGVAAATAPFPVPLRATAPEPARAEVTVRAPVRRPVAVGRNRTLTLQVAPAAKVVPHPPARTKSPVIAIANDIVAPPMFLRVAG